SGRSERPVAATICLTIEHSFAQSGLNELPNKPRSCRCPSYLPYRRQHVTWCLRPATAREVLRATPSAASCELWARAMRSIWFPDGSPICRSVSMVRNTKRLNRNGLTSTIWLPIVLLTTILHLGLAHLGP